MNIMLFQNLGKTALNDLIFLHYGKFKILNLMNDFLCLLDRASLW